MASTFKYQTIGKDKFARPFIPLTLHHKGKAVTVKALVDSGADFCMFNGELADLLDLDLATVEKISLNGVAGTAQGYMAHLEMSIEDTSFFAPAVFSFDFSPNEFGGLAGQVGLFDNFIIQFHRANMTVTLT